MLLFTVVIAFLWALYEIQIEGKSGWAGKLPTWKYKNPVKFILNWPYIDGYHVYLFLISFLVFHVQYFIGYSFDLDNEIQILIYYLTFLILEDFFWFVFNRHWGIIKFFKNEIPWHAGKFLFLPKNYWVAFVLIGFLYNL